MNSTEGPNLHHLGENELVRRIARWVASPAVPRNRPPWAAMELVAGIGDDTAIVHPAPGAPPLALTTDMLVEGRHFLPGHPPEDLGYKAAAVNLSDLAAVGAWPVWVLVSLGAPGETGIEWIEAFYRGMSLSLAPYGCACIGGDCVGSDRIVINVVAGGNPAPDVAAPLRSRARPGQKVYVTGTLGDSGAGLALLQSVKSNPPMPPEHAELIRRHRRPEARVRAGIAIARHCPDAALMDLSDGLAADLGRLGEASRCGFVLDPENLPFSSALQKAAPDLPRPPRHYSLYGGEDYELVFTTSRPETEWRDKIEKTDPDRVLPVACIGEVVPGVGIRFIGSEGEIPDPAGPYRHF
ncbi:thiamine-phosphate kinase [bacterium]|nr:thiamine-phosphate kinase [bacterium]